jgi:hypothetical protein
MTQEKLDKAKQNIMLANAQIKRDIQKLINITKILDTVGDVTLSNYKEFEEKVDALVEELEIVELI